MNAQVIPMPQQSPPPLPDWLTVPTIPTLAFSILPDVLAQSIEQQSASWQQFATAVANPPTYPSKHDCPLIKLATFGTTRSEKGSLRHDDNLLTVTGIEGDYDGGQVPMATAVERARSAGIAAVFYTSASHTPAKPRWRILCPLSASVLPAEREGLLARVDALLGGILADESYTLSQTYFYGRVAGAPFESVVVDGAPFDTVLPPSTEVRSKAKPTKGKEPTQTLPIPADIDEVLARIDPKGDYVETWSPTVLGTLNTFGAAAVPHLLKWSQPWYAANSWSEARATADIAGRIQETGTATWENVRERAGLSRADVNGLFGTLPEQSSLEGGWTVPREIPKSLRPVQPFDYDMLPAPFVAWVKDTAARKCWAPDYLAVSLMVAAATMVGRKVALQPYANDKGWVIVPTQWAANVGTPGAGKTPAADTVMHFIAPMIAKATEQFDFFSKRYENEKAFHLAKVKALEAKRLALLKGDKDNFPDEEAARAVHAEIVRVKEGFDIRKPTLKRYITDDTTPEALFDVFFENPQGVCYYPDELSKMLNQMRQDNFATLRSLLLRAANGNSQHTQDRRTNDRFGQTANVSISLLGSIQPGILPAFIGASRDGGEGDDGLPQRFGLMVWPDPIPANEAASSRQADEAAFEKVREVMNRLDAIGMADGRQAVIPFDASAEAAFNRWRCKLVNDIEQGITDPAIATYVSKYPKVLGGLALLIALVESNGEATSVPLSAWQKARQWEGYLLSHLDRIHSYATQRMDDHARNIVAKLREQSAGIVATSREGVRYTTPRHLRNNGLPGCDPVRNAADLLEWLEELGYVRLAPKGTVDNVKTAYVLNPHYFLL